MIGKLLNKIDSVRTTYLYQHSTYHTALADLPPGLFHHWQTTASLEFKGIPRDAFFFARAAEGLMMFFDCVRHSGKPCGLPSKAADSVWHAWTAFAPAHLERFCLKRFGRAMPHLEDAAMNISMDAALANTLVSARALEALPAAGLNVPRLFSLDRRLRMPKGYAYSLVRGQVGHRRMTWQGSGEGEVFFLASLLPAQLLAAGLISQLDYDAGIKRAESNNGGCGSGCGSSASDGGGGCGSSCGGGCGSGCGGGCGS